jgi:quinol---cytochrome c reductase iron-sulfur subunit, bacillus type
MLRHDDLGWSPVGSLSKPGPGEPDLRVENQPILTQFTSLVEDAYLKAAPRDVAIYVVNNGNADFTIFDDHCTHLGCPFDWNKGDGKFECPCHNGVFDAQGRVLGGPPSRPLDRYEYKVENGVLFVGKKYEVDADLRRVT